MSMAVCLSRVLLLLCRDVELNLDPDTDASSIRELLKELSLGQNKLAEDVAGLFTQYGKMPCGLGCSFVRNKKTVLNACKILGSKDYSFRGQE